MICVATSGDESERDLLLLGKLLASGGELVLASAVAVSPDDALERTQPRVRARRRALDKLEAGDSRSIVIAAAEPWTALRQALLPERPDLLLVDHDAIARTLGIEVEKVLADPPCDVAVVRGSVRGARRILVPVRGGRYAELAVRFAFTLARASGATVTVLHVADDGADVDRVSRDRVDLYRLIGTEHFDSLVSQIVVRSGDPGRIVPEEAARHDAVVIGASGRPGADVLGPVARSLLRTETPLAIVRTRVPVASSLFTATRAHGDPAERGKELRSHVDRWFLENTFASTEFADVRRLVERKERLGLRVSVALPALNEEDTIAKVVRSIRTQLMERVPLVDELVVIDSRSSDRTREIAAAEGVPVHIHDEILPGCGSHRGKGEAMWKSLHVTTGDIVVWADTDVSNFHPKFIYGIVGPLLVRPEIGFVKAFYRRPIRVGGALESSGGGRVTELAARPALNLLYPELSGFVQPLAGEQGGRRALLERLPFFTGYGVETGLLIDVFRHGGLRALAQVDMRQRTHRNRPLDDLSGTSFEVLQVALKRLGESVYDQANSSMKQISVGPDGRLKLEVKEMPAIERPPIASVEEYRARHPR